MSKERFRRPRERFPGWVIFDIPENRTWAWVQLTAHHPLARQRGSVDADTPNELERLIEGQAPRSSMTDRASATLRERPRSRPVRSHRRRRAAHPTRGRPPAMNVPTAGVLRGPAVLGRP